MTAKPRTKLTQLADHAYNAMHCPDEANRIEAVTELLAGLGINGRRIAEHLGLVPPVRKRKPVVGERPLPFRKRRTRAAAR